MGGEVERSAGMLGRREAGVGDLEGSHEGRRGERYWPHELSVDTIIDKKEPPQSTIPRLGAASSHRIQGACGQPKRFSTCQSE